jgi:class 3 adenylate cyclase
VARLSARDRAGLPDKAFAYVDSTGQRRLPVHDEAHVRSALGRFDQVRFESDDARDLARQRLLTACKRFGIMPVGFVTRQLRTGPRAPVLPTGAVTFLLTDMEGSTALLAELDQAYAGVLRDVRQLIASAVHRNGGHPVDVHGDESFSVFEDPAASVAAAIEVQRDVSARSWPGTHPVRVRAGVHSGRPTFTDGGYVGLSVHTVARICSVAHGGQVLASGATKSAAELVGPWPDGWQLAALGPVRLAGIPRDTDLYQVRAPGLLTQFPPLRVRG